MCYAKPACHFVVIYIVLGIISLNACAGRQISSQQAGKTFDNSTTSVLDTAGQHDLTMVYSLAIAEYIKAVKIEYDLSFDTLYFGKHVLGQPDDFPDIELPETIENTPIRLITPENGEKKQKERKSSFFINLMGWVEKDEAEFIFVTFSDGLKHQFDCFVNLKFYAEKGRFKAESTGFKNYLFKK